MLFLFLLPVLRISIHAPREGGDFQRTQHLSELQISIHAPREGGDIGSIESGQAALPFQSTPPARGATARMTTPITKIARFQSTPPARGATNC